MGNSLLEFSVETDFTGNLCFREIGRKKVEKQRETIFSWAALADIQSSSSGAYFPSFSSVMKGSSYKLHFTF
jgi:hypothetical protein